MFEQALTTRMHRVEAREAVFASISVFFHAAGIALLLAASWLTLSPVPLPKLHTDLVQPVFFPRAGAPAPKLGGGSTPVAAAQPAVKETSRDSAEPETLTQPATPPQETRQAASDSATAPDAAAASSAPEGPGVPDGSKDGSPDGKRGGVCVGEHCDPAGPIGEGPGINGAPSGTPDIFDPRTVQLTEPVLIQSSKTLPVYPEIARRAGVEGHVILQALIDAQGNVGSVVVLKETPERVGFGQAAARAVSQWRYRPGLLLGNPVSVQVTITVEFTLSR